MSRGRAAARRRGTPVAVLSSALGLVLAWTGAPGLAQAVTAGCSDCHAEQAELFKGSVHKSAVRCPDCHGGENAYEFTPEEFRRLGPEGASRWPASAATESFDHGTGFRGKLARAQVPERCGTCHADVERMNRYGLRTDQLALYWVSGHGRRLKQTGDTQVAVCIDCHGAHDVRPAGSPLSRTFAQKIPDTCGRCHADEALMSQYDRPASIVEQYRGSVHGIAVLERGDAGAPNCTTCHGSHGAAPPGFAEVGHVCGKCHQQTEENLRASVHGRIPALTPCIGCHAPGGDLRNHQIGRAVVPAQKLVEVFAAVRAEAPAADEGALRARFAERVAALGTSPQLATICARCHGPQRADPHRVFFAETDRIACERGVALSGVLLGAEFAYARAAERAAHLGSGVLLVRDEGLAAEEAKTELVALYDFLHTLDGANVEARAEKIKSVCQEVNGALDLKETGLVWRRKALLPIWGFVLVFFVLMYRKYLLLKRAYVRTPGRTPPAEAPVHLGRRRFLEATLTVMGSAAGLTLLWPAVSYILPVRKRGGATDRVSAGQEGDWTVWAARKIAVGGKPAMVVRTDQGYSAVSAVCTHLGCIVRWNEAQHEFDCPCHAARFDVAGRVLAGPPPAPLLEYTVSVVAGEVVVSAGKA